MNSSLKIGAVSGLIAGIVWGIADIFLALSYFNAGLPVWVLKPPPATTLMEIVLPAIIFNSIYGVILGIIFSKIYYLIPGKTGVLKGLIFGLGLYLIVWIRLSFLVYAYGNTLVAIADLLTVTPIIYGLVLGILYRVPVQVLETKYDTKSGVIPGAITGLIHGNIVVITFIGAAYLGFFFWFKEIYPEALTDIEFITNQFGSHSVINMFIMACYGALYARFNDAIPGKALVKGAIFGLTIWILTCLYYSVYYLAYGSLIWAIAVGVTFPDTYLGVGILLEGLYHKRWKAFPIAAALFILSILKYSILAVWLYPH